MNAKKIIFIILLIVFVPTAIWTLGTGNLTMFAISALAVWLTIMFCNKYLS